MLLKKMLEIVHHSCWC